MAEIKPNPPTQQKIDALARTHQPKADSIEKARRRDTAIEHEQRTAFDSMSQAIHQDGWANVMSGFGGPMDKRKYQFYANYPIIPDPELERMYFGDGIAARMIDVVADDMTREWINLRADDDEGTDEEDAMAEVSEVLQDLDSQSVFNEALKWARLYSGSIIVMGVLDGQTLDKPLNENNIQGFDYLRVIDRSDIDLFQSIYQNDPTKEGFGKPELLYCYFQVGVQRYPKLVHISRCLLFKGKKIPGGATPTTTLTQRFWGLSKLNGWYDALKDYNSNMDAVTNVLAEFVIGKFKMNGLADLMEAGKEGIIQDRMQLISLMKSVIHAVMLDSENEDYTRDTVSLSGISDILDRAALKLCAVSGIPYTRLFGDSPGGLSTDNTSGRETYYAGVRSDQVVVLQPPLRRLIDVILAWKKIDIPVEIEFNPLETVDEVQQSTIDLNKANAENSEATMYNTYETMGALSADEVRALKWADKLEGVVVVPMGPTDEEKAQYLAAAIAAEQEAAAAQGQGQTGLASPQPGTNPSSAVVGVQAAGGMGTGPDVIGQGKG